MLICCFIERAHSARTSTALSIALMVASSAILCILATARVEAAAVTSVLISPPSPATPISTRVAGILSARLREYSGVQVVSSGQADLCVSLEITSGIGSEGFTISDRPGGGIVILGNDERGLLYGVGKFLHTSAYGSGVFTPSSWRGTSVPSKPVRGIYLATHFHNYYHEAPVAEISRYVEDVSLWGVNSFLVWFAMEPYNGINDPNAQAMLTRLRAVLQTVRDLGLSPSLVCVANEGYANSPTELRAVNQPYNLGAELCVSKPGVIDMELSYFQQKFDAFKSIGLDYLVLWPYDSGGCACSGCKLWGINGYLRVSEPEARAYRTAFPQGKVVLSTWYFDKFGAGEWEGITNKFNADKPDWLDYIMADNYGGSFPEYPLIHGTPGGLPMLNFPEISMYQHTPWGGYGANPLASYLQTLWNLTKTKLSGGFPYSEGIFEDINKVMVAQLYWAPDKPTTETVREYISFFFSPNVVGSISTVMATLERNMERSRDDSGGVTKFIMKNTDGAQEAFRLVEEADATLPAQVRASWRWRIVYLRALIDSELVQHGFRVTEKCAAAFRELTTIYYAQNAIDALRPPSGLGGVLRDAAKCSQMNGLLARTWGKVVSVDPAGNVFEIDDGTGGSLSVDVGGLSVPVVMPQAGQCVAVTGIVTVGNPDGYGSRITVRPRGDDDIQVQPVD